MFVDKLCTVALILLLCGTLAKEVDGQELVERLFAGIIPRPCDCGPKSVGCTYFNGNKICTCKDDYVQAPNGTCIEPCNCQNLGDCKDNLCVCRYGSYGDHCEHVNGCEEEKLATTCGDPLVVDCVLNFRRGEPGCVCKDRSLTYDPKTRTCAECECGPDGSCSFDNGKKKCDCYSDYVMAEKGNDMEGICRPCGCGPNSDGCKYTSEGKICKCKKGFAQRVSQCKECVCGDHATCYFENYEKKCKCDKGYKMENGSCNACDCGPHGTCLYDENYKKVCTCNKDAILYGDMCVECNCGLDGSCRLNSEGKKTCTCDKGFGDREGYCIACQCYFGNEIMPCTFTGKIQNCQCPDGYKETNFVCEKA